MVPVTTKQYFISSPMILHRESLGFPDIFQVGRPRAREALQRGVAGQAHSELLNHLPGTGGRIHGLLLVPKNGGNTHGYPKTAVRYPW